LQHHGLTSGTLVVDDTDNPRSKSAKVLAHLYNLTTPHGCRMANAHECTLTPVRPDIAAPASLAQHGRP
jgi:hypothetical protein